MVKNPGAQAFRKTSLLYIFLVAAVLGGLYLYTMASYLAAPPSEGFSREVSVATVDYGFISNNQTPVVTFANGDDTLTSVAMDGHGTTFVTFDARGTVLDRFSINLDIYKASQMDAYRYDLDSVIVYYVENDLYKVIVDLETHGYSRSLVETDVRSFEASGSLLILEKADGLYGIDAGSKAASTPLVSGTILDYSATIEDEGCYVLVSISNDVAMDIRVIVTGRNFEETTDTLILGKTRDSYLKTIQDVFVQDQVLTSLYVWTDNKYSLNHLTIQQLDLLDGTITGRFSNSFPIHKGRFVIDGVKGGRVSILMQDYIHRGVNLVRATLEQGMKPEVVPLTKTRELSQLSGFFETRRDEVLVFWDSIRTTRVVNAASTEPDLVKSTTSLLTVNYLSLAGITLFVILAAAFIGTIPYLLFTSLVPLLLVLGMTRFSGEYRHKAMIQNAVAGTIGSALKLYLTWHLIHGLGQFHFRPALIGGEPEIYLALVASSVVSWLISGVHIRNLRKHESPSLGSFVVYLFADYAQYIMLVLVYVGSTMILDKI
ncbi:MAG: hypothetical protein RBT68_14280 [Spirochaetia bacterium]|jgi:hypothetical protein|nr:hypothetical protein [Spirochaetia bacterium]